jgi:erythromycin esterase-like protein
MWRNTVVRAFVQWLHDYNAALPPGVAHTGWYGLDLYSLHASIAAVLAYLNQVDPPAAQRARYRYSCLEHGGEDPHAYGYAASFDLNQACEQGAVEQLRELQRHANAYTTRDGQAAEDAFFYAAQNARLVVDAERYYRTMFRGRVAAWNIRDTYMADTLDALLRHLHRANKQTKVVVWAHNSHLGDARATEMGHAGELNVGQLVRERYGNETFSVGFSTYTGTVTAASDWGAPPERKRVRPGLRGSYEDLFHAVGIPRMLVPLRDHNEALSVLRQPRLQRAIGVVYRPQTERLSHYFEAHVADQFDALLHFDHTTAVEPLERTPVWNAGEPAETYPFGV